MTDIFNRVADMGFTGIVLEVNPFAGLVVYDSDVALRLERWPMRNDPDDMWEYNPEFDRLAEACRLGHERGLEVYAGINVFAEGRKELALEEGRDRGRVFFDHPEWGVWDYIIPPGEEEFRVLPTIEHRNDYTAFVSPHNPDVVAYELSVIREVVERYPVDGVVLDRVRYNGSHSDFGPVARAAFEERLGHPVENWPEDVYVRNSMDWVDFDPGPLYEQWQLFRAQAIHDFIVQARQTVKDANPDAIFADYVGAWYPIYYDVGVNWASPRSVPEWDGFPEGWETAGYADEMDFLMVGNYYIEVTPDEITRTDFTGDWLCVEGSANLAMDLIDGDCPAYGSLYTGQYGYESPTGEYLTDNFERAMRAAYHSTDGLMIFDLVHFDEFDLWDEVEEFIREVHFR